MVALSSSTVEAKAGRELLNDPLPRPRVPTDNWSPLTLTLSMNREDGTRPPPLDVGGRPGKLAPPSRPKLKKVAGPPPGCDCRACEWSRVCGKLGNGKQGLRTYEDNTRAGRGKGGRRSGGD